MSITPVFVFVQKSYRHKEDSYCSPSLKILYGLVKVVVKGATPITKSFNIVDTAINNGDLTHDSPYILWNQPVPDSDCMCCVDDCLLVTGFSATGELGEVSEETFDKEQDDFKFSHCSNFIKVNGGDIQSLPPIIDVNILSWPEGKQLIGDRQYLMPYMESIKAEVAEQRQEEKYALSPLPDPLPLSLNLKQLCFIEANKDSLFKDFFLVEVSSNKTAFFESKDDRVIILKPTAECKLVSF